MAGDEPVRGTKRDTTANTAINAQAAFVESIIRDTVNTAEIVSINQAEAQDTSSTGGRAKATPLVAQTDGFNNAIPTTTIPNLPFYRPQAGKAAILMRPQPGDMALAIFTKRDSSGVDVGTKNSTPPGSFRAFDQADGFLINGFLGQEPEIWLLLDPESGNIELSTKSANVEISARESGDILVKTGAGNITIQAGEGGEGTITLDGKVVVTRTIQVMNKNAEGQSQFKGGLNNTGGVVRSNNVTLETHNHSGVQSGNNNTGSPNAGS